VVVRASPSRKLPLQCCPTDDTAVRAVSQKHNSTDRSASLRLNYSRFLIHFSIISGYLIKIYRFENFVSTRPIAVEKAQPDSSRISTPTYINMPGFAQATDLSAWKELQSHHQELGRSIVLKDEFAKDPQRFEKFSRTFTNDVDKSETIFDFSKNFVNEETLKLLVKLAKEAKVEELRDDMFNGEKINFTEKRAVYHVALRNTENWPMKVDGESVVEGVNEVLEHMKEFSNQVRSGEWKGYTGKSIKTVVNIGIGGSDL